jgi:hypothetical protein
MPSRETVVIASHSYPQHPACSLQLEEVQWFYTTVAHLTHLEDFQIICVQDLPTLEIMVTSLAFFFFNFLGYILV